jgi:hypothetical protein
MPHPAGMKLRPSISGLFGVVVFATMSVCASAAPISTMTGLARSDTLPVTKVAERQHHGSQAHKARQGRRFYGAAGLDDPPAPRSDWYPHDSSQLPFGSAQWWQQMQLETGHSGR